MKKEKCNGKTLPRGSLLGLPAEVYACDVAQRHKHPFHLSGGAEAHGGRALL
jgi:hypothetical protein